jgi:hypothetical protein
MSVAIFFQRCSGSKTWPIVSFTLDDFPESAALAACHAYFCTFARS